MDKNGRRIRLSFPFIIDKYVSVIGYKNIEKKCSQAALTVDALITYNIRTIKRSRIKYFDNPYHDNKNETSINIYVELNFYLTVRSRALID